MPEKWVLQQYQSLPLRAKVGMTTNRIIEWYDHFQGAVCVNFSGGKDSTVLAHLVHDFFPDVPLVFANTGLEYPEIQAFARKMGAVFVRPKMNFSEVISKYGYPIISKENAEAIYYARRIRNKTDFGLGGRQLPKESATNFVTNGNSSEKTAMLRLGGVQTRKNNKTEDESMANGVTGEENPLQVLARSRKSRRASSIKRNGFLFA